MNNAFDIEQGSELWSAARCGIITASRCGDVADRTQKGEETAARRNYRTELVCEILTGTTVEKYVTREMQWGIDQEPFARAAYELHCNVMVEQCGFVFHPEVPRFGASPDGFIGDEGILQIKCPTTANHLEWMLSGGIPLKHLPQIIAELACTRRTWCDFVSFDPRLPEHLQLYIRRFYSDEDLITACETEILQLNSEIDEVLASLPKQRQLAPVVSIDTTIQ